MQLRLCYRPNWCAKALIIISVLTSASVAAQEPGSHTNSTNAEPRLATPDVDHSIRRMLTEQQASWNRADIAGFMRHYWKSGQLTFSSGGKTTRGWQATLDRYEKRYSTSEKMGRLTFDQLEFYSLSSDSAYVLGRCKLDRDEPIEGNFSLVVQKIEQAWKIVHDHTSVDADDEKKEAGALSE